MKYTTNNFDYTSQLYKVMKPEIYKGYPLRQISKDKFQFGIKTGTKEEIKKFIDEIEEINGSDDFDFHPDWAYQ